MNIVIIVFHVKIRQLHTDGKLNYDNLITTLNEQIKE